MEVHSKFRTLFLTRRCLFFFILLIFFLLVFYDDLSNGDLTIIAVSLFFFICITSGLLLNLNLVYEIMVTKDGITKTTFVSREAEFIPFSSVISIHSHRVPGMQGKAGQISRGYFESVLVLEDDKKLLISPDIFENYHEIIEAIRNR